VLRELSRRIAAVDAEIDTAIVGAGRATVEGMRAGTLTELGGAGPELQAIFAAEAEITQLRAGIAAIEAEAEAHAAAAQALRGSDRCPACREQVQPTDRHCRVCGEMLPAHDTTEVARAESRCDRCATPVSGGSAFCPACGWRLEVSRLPWYRAHWLRGLLAGVALYVFLQVVEHWTGFSKATILSADLLVGAFVIPLCFVFWFVERGSRSQVPLAVVIRQFVAGAVIGLGAAVVLEGKITLPGRWQYLPTGFIEEGCKGLVVLMLVRRRDLLGADKGMVLGAATGMGLAAVETTGYGLNALIGSLTSGVPIVASVQGMLGLLDSRALLAPLGHGTWTAILAGVMWNEAAKGRSPVGKPVLWAYVGVSMLHFLFDLAASSSVLTVSPLHNTPISLLQVAVGLVGLAIMLHMVHQARKTGTLPSFARFRSALRPAP
jgi:RsiW-degrading membrane proteinase PrsW (M82 family)